MSKVNEGDTLRVVLEGVVTEMFSDGTFMLADYNMISPTHRHTVSVEVIRPAKRKFKVGDKVSGDDYEALPVGTVVSLRKEDSIGFAARGPFLKVTRGEWVCTEGRYPNNILSFSPRTIVHLPES